MKTKPTDKTRTQNFPTSMRTAKCSRLSEMIPSRIRNIFTASFVALVVFSPNVPVAAAELVLFDLETHPATKVKNTTQPWTKDSNIVPVAAEVENADGKMLEITYQGTQGIGTTMIILSPEEIDSLQKMHPAGIKLLIDYDQDDSNTLNLLIYFTDGSTLTSKVKLEQGLNEYPITTGFHSPQMPLQWGLLSKIYIESASIDLKWRLKKVVVMDADD